MVGTTQNYHFFLTSPLKGEEFRMREFREVEAEEGRATFMNIVN